MATPISNQLGIWAVKISSTWTKIPKFTKLAKSGGDKTIVDATGIDDASAASVPGLPNPASYDYEGHLDAANAAHTYLATLFGNQAIAEFRYQLPGTPGPTSGYVRYDFTGQVAAHDIDFASAPSQTVKYVGKISVVTGPTLVVGEWDDA